MPLKTWNVLELCLGLTASMPREVKSWSGQMPSLQLLFYYPRIWVQQGTEEERKVSIAQSVSGQALRQADADVPVEVVVWLGQHYAGLSQLSC